LVGSDNAVYISYDDKNKVPVGVPIVNSNRSGAILSKNGPVRVADHDFVIAERHNVCVSVYQVVGVDNTKYIGDRSAISDAKSVLYIVLRNQYRGGTSAVTHWNDISNILCNEDMCLKEYGGDVGKCTKPFVVLASDGGPDVAAKNPTVKKADLNILIGNDLDSIIHVSSCKGYSRYNRCERRMVDITKAMAGHELNAFKNGKHLDSKGGVADSELCILNLDCACIELQNMLSQYADKHGLKWTVTFEDGTEDEIYQKKYDEIGSKYIEKFIDGNHCKSSKYHTQFSICADDGCKICKLGKDNVFGNEMDILQDKRGYDGYLSNMNVLLGPFSPFMPPPLAIRPGLSELRFCERKDIFSTTSTIKFADLSLILLYKNIIDLPKNFPFSFYNKEYKILKKLINDTVCGICLYQSPNYSQLMYHKRYVLHLYFLYLYICFSMFETNHKNIN